MLSDLAIFRADYMQRVELIQDLRFETATTKIKATPDGEFLIASGDLMVATVYNFSKVSLSI